MNFLYYLYASIVFSAFILITKKIHINATSDHILGPQKIHTENVPRIGGIAIYFSLLINFISSEKINYLNIILLSIMPGFASGLVEDITNKVKPIVRIFFLAISSYLIITNLDISLSGIDLPYFNHLTLTPYFSYFFTIFCLVGIANAFNIIDGLNGLTAFTSCSCIGGILYISLQFNDLALAYICLCYLSTLCGFLIFNYPLGKIFLGDAGAYILGLSCGTLAILLVNRHPNVSQWTAILLLIYPLSETVFTISRRIIFSNFEVSQADNLHLHSLIYSMLIGPRFNLSTKIANPISSLILIPLSAIPAVISSLYYGHSYALQLTVFFYCMLFVIFYLKIYNYISSVNDNTH